MAFVYDLIPPGVYADNCHNGVFGISGKRVARCCRPNTNIDIIVGNTPDGTEVFGSQNVTQICGAHISGDALKIDIVPLVVCAFKDDYDVAFGEGC